MLKGYESCRDWKEITRIINNSLKKDDNILWQNVGGIRNIFEISQMEILEEIGTMRVLLKDLASNILKGEVSYLRVGFRDTIFKVRVIEIIGNHLTLELPKEVVTKEYRVTPRIKFRPKDAKKVRLGLQLEYVVKSYQSLTFQLIDISETGLGMVVSDENLDLIKNSHSIRLEGFGNLELSFSFPIEMVYAHRLRYRYRGLVRRGNRVGIKFKEPLRGSILDTITMSFDDY